MPAEATWRLLRLESRVLSIMQKFQLNSCQDGSGEAKPTLEIGQVRNWPAENTTCCQKRLSNSGSFATRGDPNLG